MSLLANIFFIVNGRFGTHIIDRPKEIFTDSWRRDLYCPSSISPLGAIIYKRGKGFQI
jgi:hypothetical protein